MDQTLDKSPYKVGDKVWVKVSSHDPQTLPSNNVTAAMEKLWFRQGQGQTEEEAYLAYVRENNDLKASFKKEKDDEEQRLLSLPFLKLRAMDPGLDCSLQAMPPTPPQAKEQSDSDPLIIFVTGDDKSPPEVVTLSSLSSPRTDSLGEVLTPELAQSKNLPSSQQSSRSPGLVTCEVTKLSTPSQLSRSVLPPARDIAPGNIISEHLEPATDLTLQISRSVLPPATDIAPVNIIAEHLGPATDHTLQQSQVEINPTVKPSSNLSPNSHKNIRSALTNPDILSPGRIVVPMDIKCHGCNTMVEEGTMTEAKRLHIGQEGKSPVFLYLLNCPCCQKEFSFRGEPMSKSYVTVAGCEIYTGQSHKEDSLPLGGYLDSSFSFSPEDDSKENGSSQTLIDNLLSTQLSHDNTEEGVGNSMDTANHDKLRTQVIDCNFPRQSDLSMSDPPAGTLSAGTSAPPLPMEKPPALTDNESDMNTDNVFQFKKPLAANFVKPDVINRKRIPDSEDATDTDDEVEKPVMENKSTTSVFNVTPTIRSKKLQRRKKLKTGDNISPSKQDMLPNVTKDLSTSLNNFDFSCPPKPRPDHGTIMERLEHAAIEISQTTQVVPTYQPDAENSILPSEKEAGIKDSTSYQQQYRSPPVISTVVPPPTVPDHFLNTLESIYPSSPTNLPPQIEQVELSILDCLNNPNTPMYRQPKKLSSVATSKSVTVNPFVDDNSGEECDNEDKEYDDNNDEDYVQSEEEDSDEDWSDNEDSEDDDMREEDYSDDGSGDDDEDEKKKYAAKKPLSKAELSANRKKNKNTFPPSNPHDVQYTGDDGHLLHIDSVEYLVRFANDQKVHPKTEKKYLREFNNFLTFISTKRPESSVAEDVLSSSLPATELCTLLCQYIVDRCNLTVFRETGDVIPLDTSTQDLNWYAMAHVFKKKTSYLLTTDKAFLLAREAKCSMMRRAKAIADAGLGQLSHQMLPLAWAQLKWLLSNDHLGLTTGRGMQWLTFLLVSLYFLPRVREEMRNITRGDFKRVRGPSKKVVGVLYVPHGTTKKDRGDQRAHDVSGYYKRPFAMVSDIDKLNMDLHLTALEKQLDLLPHDGPRSTQKIFKQVRTGIHPPGEPFFLPGDLGYGSFDQLLRSMIWASGMQVDKLQLPNQAIRPTVFCLHRRVGVHPRDTAASAGHSSKNTQETYKRGDLMYSAVVNAKVQEVVGGTAVDTPESKFVRLYNGQVMLPRPFNKPINRPSSSSAESLPLGSMELDEYYQYVSGPEPADRSPAPPANTCEQPQPSTSGLHLHSSWQVDGPSEQKQTAVKKPSRKSDPTLLPAPAKKRRVSLPASLEEDSV